MVTRIKSGALAGIEGLAVMVEVDISRGLPGFYLVGLPNTEVRESRQRVLAALRNSGVKLPAGKITVNLAPAGIKKEGASFDLAIAMGVMAAQGRTMDRGCLGPHEAPLFLGELSLSGRLLPVRGLLAMVLAAAERGDRLVVVPAVQVREASLAPGVRVLGMESLRDAIHWWDTGQEPLVASAGTKAICRPKPVQGQLVGLEGQPSLLKAAVVAAAGGHNMLMVGPPGTGKTRLARLLGSSQPPLTQEEALEVTRIHSAAGILADGSLVQQRPFRAPHHTLTRAGLVGGGLSLRPGEVTLAHRGILFLDEMSEFSPAVLDVLREPLEEGRITLARGAGHRSFPADFQLLGAMNPCRCGFLGSGLRTCRCSPAERRRYLSRLSGPLLDRFDLFVQVGPWQGRFLENAASKRPRKPATDWRKTVTTGCWPDLGVGAQGKGQPAVSAQARRHLDALRQPLGLSLRSVHSCLRVAATVARLDGSAAVEKNHVVEALEFRLENLALETLV